MCFVLRRQCQSQCVSVQYIATMAVDHSHMLSLIDLAETIGVHSVLASFVQSATRRSSAPSTATDTVGTVMTRRGSGSASSMTTNPTATTRTVRLKRLTVALAQISNSLSMCICIGTMRSPHSTRDSSKMYRICVVYICSTQFGANGVSFLFELKFCECVHPSMWSGNNGWLQFRCLFGYRATFEHVGLLLLLQPAVPTYALLGPNFRFCYLLSFCFVCDFSVLQVRLREEALSQMMLLVQSEGKNCSRMNLYFWECF